MRCLVRDHQSKSAAYQEALKLTEGDGTVVLIDYDLPHPAYEGWPQVAAEHDAPLIIYPHGFTATMAHNLIVEPIKADAALVPGPGQKFLMELYGYPTPVHVIGWPGPRHPFIPRKLRRILFAPHHPLGSGYMQPDCREANARAFRILLDEPCELTVRHVGTLEQNGIWEEPGVEYVSGRMDGSLDSADVVVAGGTYAANALVHGIPVVMYDQDREWRLESEHGPETAYPPNWQEHRDFTRYPFDLAPGVCEEAALHPSPPDAEAWRDRFLGPPFDPQAFARLIEQIKEGRCLPTQS